MMKNELAAFYSALMFYTRIPVPKDVPHSQEIMDESTKYFPLIGWIVGIVTAAVFYFTALFVPVSVSILLSMIAGILLTGAFHEDGFADFCDGFGGGWSKEQVLTIMKDSRIGTYGAIGIGLMLLLKFTALRESYPVVGFLLFSGHALSRFSCNVFRFHSQYVRENEDSKAKPMAKAIDQRSLLISAGFGLLPVIFIFKLHSVYLILAALLTQYVLARYCEKRIGGYTGDCLGACQQLSEAAFYISFLILWKFI